MHVLLFWKDFELMIKEHNKDLMATEISMFSSLNDQINELLQLTDLKIIEEMNIDNRLIIAECDDVIKNWNQIKEQIVSISNKNALNLPKLSVDDNSNNISLLNITDKNFEMVSPVSGSVINNSLSWITPKNIDYEVLRKDILRLTEENKYLKKRVSSGKIGIDSKCQLWQKYISIIDNLLVKHALEENQLKEKVWSLQTMLKSNLSEIDNLKSKYDLISKELTSKIENENIVNTKLAELENKKNSLMEHIKTTLDSSHGFELLEDTLANLSLALINKNDKDLSYKQKQLIRDLFEDKNIKVINGFKEKISILEAEKLQALEISKKQTEGSKNMLKLAKKYAFALKEWVDIYNYMDVPITKLDESDTIEYFNKHASNILRDFNDEINYNIHQISEYSVEINNDLMEVDKFNGEFIISKYEEVWSPKFNIKSPSSQGFMDKSQNYDKNSAFSDTNNDFMKKVFTTFSKESPTKTNISGEKDLSREEQKSLLSALQLKDKEIQELKEKCKEVQNKPPTKKLKKKKSKTFKKSDEKEKMIKESLEELQMLIDDEEPSIKQENYDNQIKLIALENNTINEADEKDEEETLYDKEANAVFSSSLKSSKCNLDDKPKISIKNYATVSDGEDKEKIYLEKIHHGYNFSIESESVRFDEDLLNDTLKLDEPMF